MMLGHPKMYPHTKFGIPTSKNIGDVHGTRSGTDGRTDGRTVRLLYASQSSFGGIKIFIAFVSCSVKQNGFKQFWRVEISPCCFSSIRFIVVLCLLKKTST